MSTRSQPTDPGRVCQSPEMFESTSYYPRVLTRLRLTLWYVEREGLLGTLRRVTNTFAVGISTALSSARKNIPAVAPSLAEEVLNLQPGEWVEVKSREEILATLDVNGKSRGLRFVPEMFEYCGHSYRVLKRVEKICIENTPDVRRIKNTVLLEEGICKGGGIGCDRACFHFWREFWLRRANSPTIQ